MRAVLLCVGALAAVPAAGQEPLAFTVRPSGVEGGENVETLDQKLARREHGFRFICVGCARAAGPVDARPFEPIRTLNAPELTAVFDAERAERIGEGP